MNSEFVILNPCSKRWADLEGSGRSRFCGSCQTFVHSIKEFSTEEWGQLCRESKGHVCAFATVPPVERPRTRREILVGALLSFAAPLLAQDGEVWIRVVDQSGAIRPEAQIALLDPQNQPVQTRRANPSGEIVFSGLALGNHSFRAECVGFSTLQFVAIARGDKPERLDIVLRIEAMIMGTIVEAMPPVDARMPIGQGLDPAASQRVAPRQSLLKKRRWWWPF